MQCRLSPRFPSKKVHHTFYATRFSSMETAAQVQFHCRRKLGSRFISNSCSFSQVIDPPPPVATGPGLDRPLFTTDGGLSEGVTPASYTMARTRRFYQEQMASEPQPPPPPPSASAPRRMESLDSSLGSSSNRGYGR